MATSLIFGVLTLTRATGQAEPQVLHAALCFQVLKTVLLACTGIYFVVSPYPSQPPLSVENETWLQEEGVARNDSFTVGSGYHTVRHPTIPFTDMKGFLIIIQ